MKKVKLTLFLLLLIAGFLRFYKLNEYPVGFHIDEASLGYNAYSLLKTARDENGQLLPLHIDMFGDYRPAGYQYLDILPVMLLGLNELATRLPSALFGVLTVVAIYFLAQVIFENFRPALLAVAVLTFSPWHIVISRASAETIVALFFIILGTAFFIKGIKGASKQFWLAAVFLLIGLFFYHSSRVFVPMLAMILIFLFYPAWKKKNNTFKSSFVLCFLVVLVVSLFLLFGSKGGVSRFEQVSIFHFPEIRLVLAEQIREDGVAKMSVFLTRAFHNKLVNYGLGFLQEYFRYFSLNYLFIKGGLPAWYAVPHMGLMYLIELPFLIVGLFRLVNQGRKKGILLVPVLWLILAPVIAAVTRDDVPNVQRSLIMLPALLLITAFGLWQVFVFVQKKLKPKFFKAVLLVFFFVFLWNFSYFVHQYFVHGKLHRPWYRFNGFKEMVLAVNKLAPNYDKIIVSKSRGGTYMHFLFFQKFDPDEYQRLGSPRDRDYQGFGKLIFVPAECPSAMSDSGEKVLLVSGGNCSGGQPIYREDKTVIFKIHE